SDRLVDHAHRPLAQLGRVPMERIVRSCHWLHPSKRTEPPSIRGQFTVSTPSWLGSAAPSRVPTPRPLASKHVASTIRRSPTLSTSHRALDRVGHVEPVADSR